MGKISQLVRKKKAVTYQDFSINLEEAEAFGNLVFARGTYTYTAAKANVRPFRMKDRESHARLR
jgi:hypothetical protein